jgi:hypothetical protein
MSVWTDPHYRSEPLIVTTELLEHSLINHKNVLDLCDFTINEYGHFPVPAPPGNLKQNIQKGLAKIQNVAYRFGKRASPTFSDRFRTFSNLHFGLDAVYELYTRISQKSLNFKPEFNTTEFQEFGAKFLKSYGPAGYSSPKTWEDFSDTVFKTWIDTDQEQPLFWLQQAEAIRHLTVAGGLKSYKSAQKKAKTHQKPWPALDKMTIFGRKQYPWRAYRIASLTILEYKVNTSTTPLHKETHATFILLNKDLTRLSQMLESTGKVYHYFQNYADEHNALSRKLVTAASTIFSLLHTAFRRQDKHGKNSICRSMDIGMYEYLAEKAGPLSARSKAAQYKKGHDGHYNVVFPLDEFTGILRQFQIREALELASIRRILPVPDFCIYGNQFGSYSMHTNPHSELPFPDPDVNWDDFSLYWDHSMIRNYYDRHQVCPGTIKPGVEHKNWHASYPHIVPKRIPYVEVGDINWEGTFVYQDYNFAEHELRKDKVMAPKKLPVDTTSRELAELPIWERNQIAAMIMDPMMKRLAQYRQEILTNTESFDYVHLVAMKPESKKEGGRNFYMANDPQRILMSEKEANVADYLLHKAGNSAGITDVELAKQMKEIALLPTNICRKVFISFDLEKWSPQQSPRLKTLAYEKWGYAFGLPHIKALLKVHNGSRLAFIKHNISHEYINPGQDMEGYDAKTNTAMHIEVMSYAINVCRRKGLVTKGAKLLCLIDDGGMSLEFDINATNEEILNCINMIEKVYQMVGLRISWDKTFVSEKLFQYLNEVYYNGFKVTPGLKAFLRVGRPIDMPAKTIVDDLDAIAGELQGAIKAGSSYMMSYSAYAFEIYRVIKRWGRYKVKITDRHILMCLTPVALGGLGVRSMIQLCTNESFNPLAAGIGNLKAFVTYYRRNAPLVNALLKTRMRETTADTFLRAPRAIRVEGRTLNLRRFENRMRDWIKKAAKNPYITSVLAAAAPMTDQTFVSRIAQMKEVSAIGLQALSDLRPDTAVDQLIGKLQRSQTAASLLGFEDVIRLTLANRYQTSQLIEHFGLDLQPSYLLFQKN